MKKIIIMALIVIVLGFLFALGLLRIYPFHNVSLEYNKCIENYDGDKFIECVNELFTGKGIFIMDVK